MLPAQATASVRAQSRVIYLNHDGVILPPGDNDASQQVSSIVAEPTAINGWDIDDQTWAQTVACVANLYAPFDVTITDQDPGDVPHIEAIVGGDPSDVGLPENVAGVSPFTSDCSIISGWRHRSRDGPRVPRCAPPPAVTETVSTETTYPTWPHQPTRRLRSMWAPSP